ncbi:hypothetical protein F2Q68_00020201 [Brassica cretica]|uniref:Uncharacterized protein n=1 Tax=Brassica cretica TaxID=69181 RepID=A0A8S9FXY0_BRACR|nr:hypothetical protein F2Q68_00020201 [Brassica cretica]
MRIMTHEEFTAKHPHPPSPIYLKIDRHQEPVIDLHQEPVIDRHQENVIDRHQETVIDRQLPAPIDRRAPITYRVQMQKIDVERLNALRPKPKPSENPPEAIRTPSDDGIDSLEVDRVPTGRTLRKRKEKVAKNIKRGANEKENESFQRRVFRIPLQKPFDEAHYTHRLKQQTTPRRINDPGIIAACHCGAEYETEYSASIEIHTATSIDCAHQKSTDTPKEESVDSSPEDWENDYYNPTMAAYTRQNMHTEEYDEDYEEERATEYKNILDEEDKLLHHCSWKKNAPSIDRTSSPSIDT